MSKEGMLRPFHPHTRGGERVYVHHRIVYLEVRSTAMTYWLAAAAVLASWRPWRAWRRGAFRVRNTRLLRACSGCSLT